MIDDQTTTSNRWITNFRRLRAIDIDIRAPLTCGMFPHAGSATVMSQREHPSRVCGSPPFSAAIDSAFSAVIDSAFSQPLTMRLQKRIDLDEACRMPDK